MLPLGMIIARIPVGEDDSVGNNLGEWITLRGKKYSSDLAGEQYSVGREMLCWNVDNNLLRIPLLYVGSADRLRWG